MNVADASFQKRQDMLQKKCDYYQRNRERFLAIAKEKKAQDPQAFLAYRRSLRRRNHAKFLEKERTAMARYRAENREKIKAYQLAWYHKNKGKRGIANQKRVTEEHRKSYKINWQREKYHTCPVNNLKTKTRRRISMALRECYKGKANKARTIELLGCSYEFFKEHIESLFRPGMTWNQVFTGEIHLDHKRPVASYDLTKPEEMAACFHYSNVQPLWKRENLLKSDKVDYAA